MNVQAPLRASTGRHLPALDGLRGAAALAVLGYHLLQGNPLFPLARFGWTGVDLFFVLSGFLITGILYDTRHAPHYFRTFYGRRALRILPLYIAFLLLYGGLVLLAGNAASTAAYRAQFPFLLTYTQNPYWTPELPAHLMHTWTLAVEEQFYLLWPAVVFLLRDRVRLMIACALIIVAAIIFRAVADPQTTYVLLPARIDALAIGAFVALWSRGNAGMAPVVSAARRALLPLLIAVIALVVLAGPPGIEAETRFQQWCGYTMWAALYATVLVLAVAGVGGRVFGSRFLRYSGRVSYALYLLHPPILSGLREAGLARGSWMLVITGLLASYAAAALSWKFVEAPMLALKRHVPYRERAAAAVPRLEPAG